MAKSTKTGSNGHHNGKNGSESGTRRIFEDVLALAGTLARGRKEMGADKLHSLASSTREFAAAMTDMPNLRGHVASAAESLEDLSDYVLHTEIEQMAGDAGIFARRHPIATLTLTVMAGMAAGLFLRRPQVSAASSRRSAGKTRRTAASGRKRPGTARGGTNGKAQAHA